MTKLLSAFKDICRSIKDFIHDVIAKLLAVNHAIDEAEELATNVVTSATEGYELFLKKLKEMKIKSTYDLVTNVETIYREVLSGREALAIFLQDESFQKISLFWNTSIKDISDLVITSYIEKYKEEMKDE